VSYDVLSTLDPLDFMSGASCVASDVVALTCADTSTPALGQALFYLVRPRNACPQGQGPLGDASNGTERVGRSCP